MKNMDNKIGFKNSADIYDHVGLIPELYKDMNDTRIKEFYFKNYLGATEEGYQKYKTEIDQHQEFVDKFERKLFNID